MRRIGLMLSSLCLFVLVGRVSLGAEEADVVRLPQKHPYQQALREYMADLTVKDFEHGVTEKLRADAASNDPEVQYRLFIMTQMMQPMVGFKRGKPSINAPAWLFLLSTIEGPATAPPQKPGPPVPAKKIRKISPGPIRQPTGIVVPPVWPDALVAFCEWDYPGNVFKDNRALKMRAFVTAAVRMIMHDEYLDSNPIHHRADWNAYRLVTFSRTYEGVADVLPGNVRKAFKAGILRLGKRVLSWPRKGEFPEADANGPIGLLYASRACDDEAFTAAAEAEARKMFTDPERFNQAGYWVERGGGLDLAFGGMSSLYAVWIALMTDWEVAEDAVDRLYRLRAHLSLPDPDGVFAGPSHFNSRIGSPVSEDQWHWNGVRESGAAMISDEALHVAIIPDAEVLSQAGAKRVGKYNYHIFGHLRNPYHRNKSYGYVPDDEIRGNTWKWRVWDTRNFPLTVNPAHAFYRKDALARLRKAQKEDSPLLKSPFLREGTFARDFGGVFAVSKQERFAAILHLGPVGILPKGDGNFQWSGPLGFGGGQLSAFWTKKTGSVILGRRSGMSYDKCYDDMERWRLWPLHAVSGMTTADKVFTTARITRPATTLAIDGSVITATAGGVLPAEMLNQKEILQGSLAYSRTFVTDEDSVQITTTLTGDGKDKLAELFETIPVFLRAGKKQKKVKPTVIEFRTGATWQAGTPEWQDKVEAVKLSRFNGAVVIAFDVPQRVRLSAEVWQDRYITRAQCRNIMIDRLGGDGTAATVSGKKTLRYRITPAE